MGSHLCDRLLSDDCEVLCVDNYFSGAKQNIFGHSLSIQCTALDAARVGHLWLNKGNWSGIQVVPEEYMGEIITDLNSRRGRVRSMEARAGTQIVDGRVPLAEMFGYATDLRSRTQGRATYSMHFDRYEQVPNNVSEEVVARIQGR